MKTILCVEDGTDDVLLIRLALKAGGIHCQLQAVSNIQSAQAYLRGEAIYSDREAYPFPSLVLSDISLPGGSGLDLLSWIRKEHPPEALPVIIMTGSADEKQWNIACNCGANDCVPKTADFREVIEKIKANFPAEPKTF